jgi:hypothetical protein
MQARRFDSSDQASALNKQQGLSVVQVGLQFFTAKLPQNEPDPKYGWTQNIAVPQILLYNLMSRV